jgi:hypothetical protein
MLVALALAAAAAAPAAATADSPAPGGFNITSPDKSGAVLLNGTTGATLSGRLEAFNTSRRPKVLRLQAADLNTASSGGLSYGTTHPRRAGAWVRLNASEVRIPARSSVNVAFTVAVPRGVRGGSHYAGIVATDARRASAQTASVEVGKGRRSVQVGRIVRVAVPVTVRLPGPRTRNVAYTGASLNTDATRPALALALENTGTALIDGARISFHIERDGKRLMKHTSTMAVLMPDSGVRYSVPWTAGTEQGDYRLVGTVTPRGARRVNINEVLTVSAKQADKLAAQTRTPEAAVAPKSTPMALWAALGAAALLVAAMGVAMWRMLRRMKTGG